MHSNFIDYVKFYGRAGAGGAGAVHFRREKHVPKGGPDGGDGGRGGHIILRGNKQYWTLLHLRYQKHIHADNGQPGSSSNKSGSCGSNIYLEVPLGTIAKKFENGELIAEICHDGQEQIIIHGGLGGLGNTHFKTATNQAPKYAQSGGKAIECTIILELKLLADVGIIGFPNAGKSTLLSTISDAKPQIGNYPFTTLTPNLGVVPYRDYKSFIIADIPGIIEGASKGKGLGIRFLKHIERNSILLFLIPCDSDNIGKEYSIILNELEQHNSELLEKKRLLAISKSDILDEELMNDLKKELPKNVNYLFISSINQLGLLALKDKIWQMLQK